MKEKPSINLICADDLDLDNPMIMKSKTKKKKSNIIKRCYRETPGWVLWIDKTHLIPIIRIRYNKKCGGTQ